MFKVLIIDDEPWAREVVKSLGEWETLQLKVVGEAEDGQEGLGLIEEMKPHIVITDMRMPGVDGISLLQRINADFPSIKIIVMSGYDDFVYLKQAITSRALEYLLKPIGEMELNDALRKCIKELQEQQQTLGPLRNMPLEFSSREQSDRYVMLRQRIFAALIGLDVYGVVVAFERLSEFLIDALLEKNDEATNKRIREDYVDLLERYLAEHHECSLSDILEEQTLSMTEPLQELPQLYTAVIERVEAVRKSKTRLTIDEVKSYIEKHYGDPITLETISHRFYVSKEHLSRAFKGVTGENLTNFIVRVRMEKAKHLLENTDTPIKHAAWLAGYPELAYFHRVFKKHFGITPGEYKREHEK